MYSLQSPHSPDFFHGLINLKEFAIFNNTFLEPWILPNDLTHCTKLETFHASFAKITGPMPDTLNHLTNLEILNLSYNNLNESLLSHLYNFSKLSDLTLHSTVVNRTETIGKENK